MPTSGMLRRMALVRADISEEHIACIIMVTRIVEIGTLAVTSEAIRSFETSVLIRATRRNIPEDGILHSHRREHFKSYLFNY
jgi:hypothetical protein